MSHIAASGHFGQGAALQKKLAGLLPFMWWDFGENITTSGGIITVVGDKSITGGYLEAVVSGTTDGPDVEIMNGRGAARFRRTAPQRRMRSRPASTYGPQISGINRPFGMYTVLDPNIYDNYAENYWAFRLYTPQTYWKVAKASYGVGMYRAQYQSRNNAGATYNSLSSSSDMGTAPMVWYVYSDGFSSTGGDHTGWSNTWGNEATVGLREFIDFIVGDWSTSVLNPSNATIGEIAAFDFCPTPAEHAAVMAELQTRWSIP